MAGKVPPGERVLIADGGSAVDETCARVLGERGYRLRVAPTADAALHAAQRFLPDLVIIDADLPPAGGVALCRELRADRRTAWASIILLSGRTDAEARLTSLVSGADDHLFKPVEARELLVQVEARLERSLQLRGLSPLTGLPGNFTIRRELEVLLESAEPFALVHADLNRFKTFNDRYGFLRGDEAIRATGQAVVEAVGEHGALPRFVGHVGGDDFAVLIPPEEVVDVCTRIAAQVALALPPLHDAADVARGYLEVVDRRGMRRRSPLLTISMGVAVSTLRSFGSAAEVSSVANEMKTLAKAQPGSAWRVDRRRA